VTPDGKSLGAYSNPEFDQWVRKAAAAKTEKEKGSKGISVFIVERDYPGVSVGRDEEKMGRHCSSMSDVIFEDVKVPAENLLVPAGKGFKEMMIEFNSERCGNSSLCIGMAQSLGNGNTDRLNLLKK
jgi:alkylation response protein AidB-like acyl-CoA dehydrogenase